jgi:hypothetical protein
MGMIYLRPTTGKPFLDQETRASFRPANFRR